MHADPEVAGRWRSVFEKSLIEVCVVATVGEGLRESRMTRFGAVVLAEELLPTPQGQELVELCLDGVDPISLLVLTTRFDAANSVELRGRGAFEYLDNNISESEITSLAESLDNILSDVENQRSVRRGLR